MVLHIAVPAYDYEKLRPPIARETTAEAFEETAPRIEEPEARSPSVEWRRHASPR
jgi:hypothetical protein